MTFDSATYPSTIKRHRDSCYKYVLDDDLEGYRCFQWWAACLHGLTWFFVLFCQPGNPVPWLTAVIIIKRQGFWKYECTSRPWWANRTPDWEAMWVLKHLDNKRRSLGRRIHYREIWYLYLRYSSQAIIWHKLISACSSSNFTHPIWCLAQSNTAGKALRRGRGRQIEGSAKRADNVSNISLARGAETAVAPAVKPAFRPARQAKRRYGWVLRWVDMRCR